MTRILFVNRNNKHDFVDVISVDKVELHDAKGLRGKRYEIRYKSRKNTKTPVILGRFLNERIRAEEFDRIKEAIKNQEDEYTVQNALPVDRDFSKIVEPI